MMDLMNKLYIKVLCAVAGVKTALKDEKGETNIIAIIVILAIVIALAIVFRTQLRSLFDRIWSTIFDRVDGI